MKDWEIGFETPEYDYYFFSPEARIAEYAKWELSADGITNLTCADAILVYPDGDYVIIDGAYARFLRVDWPQGKMVPAAVHGLDGIGKFGRLIVSTKIMAYILFYFEGIESTRLFYFDGAKLSCLRDHLREIEDEYLNENDHLTRKAAELFRAAAREDEVLQNEKLAELAEFFDEEESDELEGGNNFSENDLDEEESDELDDDDEFDEDDLDESNLDGSDFDIEGDSFVYEVAGHKSEDDS